MEKLASFSNANNADSQAPRALVIWSQGLSGRPEIFPLGKTDTEIETIQRYLERALSKTRED